MYMYMYITVSENVCIWVTFSLVFDMNMCYI